MLSAHYSLANLTATNQNLSEPNLPQNANQYDNLVFLANMLEELDAKIGPFQYLSGFRTGELQNKLASQGEPTATGTSFHELGRAVDIAPTTMTPTEYFGRLLADEELKNKFSEIAIKPSQNALHLSINVRGDERTPKVLGLNQDGVYAKLGLDEIAGYIQPYMQSAAAAYDYAAAQLVTINRLPLIIMATIGLAGAAYLLMGSKRKA
jgi:hypothetical protein